MEPAAAHKGTSFGERSLDLALRISQGWGDTHSHIGVVSIHIACLANPLRTPRNLCRYQIEATVALCRWCTSTEQSTGVWPRLVVLAQGEPIVPRAGLATGRVDRRATSAKALNQWVRSITCTVNRRLLRPETAVVVGIVLRPHLHSGMSTDTECSASFTSMVEPPLHVHCSCLASGSAGGRTYDG